MASNISVLFYCHLWLYDIRILQDYWILLVTGRWRSQVEKKQFQDIPSVWNHQVQVPYTVQPTLGGDTSLNPLSQICINILNPNQENFLPVFRFCITVINFLIIQPNRQPTHHRCLRHGFCHSHDGSLRPWICWIKGTILRPRDLWGISEVWNVKIGGSGSWETLGKYTTKKR